MGLGGTEKKPALLIALGKGGGEEKSDKDDDEDDDVLEVGDDEVEAMQAFETAKSTEEKAKALKAFIKLCEGY